MLASQYIANMSFCTVCACTCVAKACPVLSLQFPTQSKTKTSRQGRLRLLCLLLPQLLTHSPLPYLGKVGKWARDRTERLHFIFPILQRNSSCWNRGVNVLNGERAISCYRLYDLGLTLNTRD